MLAPVNLKIFVKYWKRDAPIEIDDNFIDFVDTAENVRIRRSTILKRMSSHKKAPKKLSLLVPHGITGKVPLHQLDQKNFMDSHQCPDVWYSFTHSFKLRDKDTFFSLQRYVKGPRVLHDRLLALPCAPPNEVAMFVWNDL